MLLFARFRDMSAPPTDGGPMLHRLHQRRGVTATMALALVLAAGASSATAGPRAQRAAKPITVALPYGDFFQGVVDKSLKTCQQQTGIAGRTIADPATYDELNLKLLVQARAGKAPDLVVNGLNEVI